MKRSILLKRKTGIAVLLCILLLAPMRVSWSETRAPAKDIPDFKISRAVETELTISPVVSPHLVDVNTREGVVTLSGSVESLLAKDRAGDLAQSVVGVRSVVNRLTVLPRALDDGQLRARIEKALIEDPATDAYEIEVTVEDGVAEISGTVASWAEKELAAEVTRQVKGLKGVTNAIDVDVALERSDEEIENEIRARLKSDVYIDEAFIHVAVVDGKVVLSGTAGSLVEKSRAVNAAYVSGVTSVDGALLNIQWWAKDPQKKKSMEELYPPDMEIRDAVKAALFYDPRVSSFDIDVDVSGGGVRLSGVVDNLKAKRSAAQDARNTLGVWQVENHIKVRPTGVFADENIREDILAALGRDVALGRYDITVNVINQKAYLYGSVDSNFHKNRAEDIVSRVKGVVEVTNYLTVSDTWAWKSDSAIASDVEGQLYWSPYVDSEDLSVAVDDGRVTITGTATDWAEADAAVKNAFDGGAKSVRADIELSSGNEYNYYYDSYEDYNLPYYGYYPYFGTIGTYGIVF